MSELVKYGFVYIWFDKENKRFYIGSHWGNPNDGYICSSPSMKENYLNRPEDFKRRILKRIYSNREDLLVAEQIWLNLIPREDFGKRYYNINAKSNDYSWWVNEETRKQVSKKFVGNKNNLGKKLSKKSKAKIAKKLVGNKNGEGERSNEWRQTMQKNNWSKPRSELQQEVLSKGRKKGQQNSPINKKGWIPIHRIGTHHSDKTKEKMSKSMQGNTNGSGKKGKSYKHLQFRKQSLLDFLQGKDWTSTNEIKNQLQLHRDVINRYLKQSVLEGIVQQKLAGLRNREAFWKMI